MKRVLLLLMPLAACSPGTQWASLAVQFDARPGLHRISLGGHVLERAGDELGGTIAHDRAVAGVVKIGDGARELPVRIVAEPDKRRPQVRVGGVRGRDGQPVNGLAVIGVEREASETSWTLYVGRWSSTQPAWEVACRLDGKMIRCD